MDGIHVENSSKMKSRECRYVVIPTFSCFSSSRTTKNWLLCTDKDPGGQRQPAGSSATGPPDSGRTFQRLRFLSD